MLYLRLYTLKIQQPCRFDLYTMTNVQAYNGLPRRTAIEKEMDENVFYTITDDKKRTQRLIQIYASLNTRQRMAFKSLLDRQTQ